MNKTRLVRGFGLESGFRVDLRSRTWHVELQDIGKEPRKKNEALRYAQEEMAG